MRDPYEILGVSPSASDEDVKKAYRDMVRKYHPDNYHNDPLEDLAQERMKEINEAYDRIEQMRSGKGAGGFTGGYAYSGNQSYTSNPTYQAVRNYIHAGALDEAERLLQSVTQRDAQWHFLYGMIAYRRGWLDEARQHVQRAAGLDPGNMEYRQALQQLQFGGVHVHTVRSGPLASNIGMCMTLFCLSRYCCYC